MTTWLLPAWASATQDGAVTLPRLVFELTEPARPVPAAVAGLPLARRVRVTASDLSRRSTWLLPGAAAREPVPVWLTIALVDAPDVDPASWPQQLRTALLAVPLLAAVELELTGSDPQRAAFLLKLSAAEVRGVAGVLPVVLGGAAASAKTRETLLTADVTPSIDALSLPPGEDAAPAWTWLNEHDPGAVLVDLHAFLADDDPATAFATREIARLGGPPYTQGYRLSSTALAAVLPVASRLRNIYAGEVVPVRADSGSVTLTVGGTSVSETRPWRLLYNVATLGTYLVTAGPATGQERLDVSTVIPAAGAVVVRDPATGRDVPALRAERDDATQRTTAAVRLPGPGPWLIDFNRGAAAGFVQQEDVTGQRTLRVEEILARHQAQQAAQRLAVPRYVVDATIRQYFRPTLTDPGFDVVTANRFFVDEVDGMEWEEREFSVNGAHFGEPRPPFPLLQPEKVLAPPLVVELDARYRYRLRGIERVDGRQAYVVAFEPARRDQTLYRGSVWIDTETFARVRQQAVQTNLGAPVVSNDETQEFIAVASPSGRDVYLPLRLINQQLVLVAGRNLLVERRVTFANYAIAPADFVAQRQAARLGGHTMYKDTVRGVRYFVKDGDRRVVSETSTTKAKALALGVTIDPGFGYPLPIGGINYLDFSFGGRSDTQLAVLFAGVLVAGNLQRPKAIGGVIDVSVDFFAIAPPSTDRLFDQRGEREDTRLLTWPLSTGLNLGWQATSFQKISGQYQFRFDGYVKDRTTSEAFTTPTSTVTNGLGVLYEYRRGGYSVTANGVWSRRARWRDWGNAGALERTSPDYEKYALSAAKVFYLGPFSKIIVNGAWYTGRRLDRFSQYQFGLFDETRIHGVPSAGVRYGELAMTRGQYSFNIFDQYRIDVFLDRAWGRAGGTGRGLAEARATRPWEPITGIGTALNVKVPGRNMILRA
ncbi:MAG: sigma-E factor regulatory protein RseB domain-containing protein, partial [Luteitalea sp.]